jgi:hypothetical protein
LKTSIVQQSFAAGEVSPLVGGRSDTTGYQNGVEKMLNMYADSRGPAISRGGSELIDQLSITSTNSIMRVIQARIGQSIVAIIYDDKIALFTEDGKVFSTEYIQNGDFIDGDASWGTILIGNNSDVIYNYRNTQIIPGTGTNAALIRQIVTVSTTTPYTLRITLNQVGTFSYSIGTTQSSDDVIAETFVTTSEVIVNFTTLATTTVYFTIRTDAPIETDPIFVNSVSIYDQGAVGIEFTTPWLFSNKNKIRTIEDSANSRIFFLEKEAPVQFLSIDPLGVFTFGPAGFISPPVSWIGNNYPKVGAIHEGRLWLSNDTLEFWYSVSNSYLDFTPGILAAESGSLVISDVGVINWIETGKNLLIGTEVKEYIVNSQAGVIYVGDFSIQEQSSYGSAFVRPVKIGDLLVYVSPDRRKIRAMQFQFVEDRFLSTDLAFFSEHITQGRIKEMAWQQDPDNILWVVLDDGTYIGLTYERSNNVWGWHSHNTKGTVLNIGAAASIDNSKMFLYVNRAQSPEVVNSIDAYRRDDVLDGQVKVDLGAPSLTVDGFDALFNNEAGIGPAIVEVFADGNYMGEMTVTSPGRLTFTSPVSSVQAGYSFSQKLVTLPLNKGGQNGASEPWFKGFNKLYVKIYDSFIPLVNGIRPPSRQPSTPMNQMQGKTTEVLEISQTGYELETRVTIEQDLPRKLTVIYIAGELDQNQL